MSFKNSFQVLRKYPVREVVPEDKKMFFEFNLTQLWGEISKYQHKRVKCTPCRQSTLHETNVTPMLSGKDGYMA